MSTFHRSIYSFSQRFFDDGVYLWHKERCSQPLKRKEKEKSSLIKDVTLKKSVRAVLSSKLAMVLFSARLMISGGTLISGHKLAFRENLNNLAGVAAEARSPHLLGKRQTAAACFFVPTFGHKIDLQELPLTREALFFQQMGSRSHVNKYTWTKHKQLECAKNSPLTTSEMKRARQIKGSLWRLKVHSKPAVKCKQLNVACCWLTKECAKWEH